MASREARQDAIRRASEKVRGGRSGWLRRAGQKPPQLRQAGGVASMTTPPASKPPIELSPGYTDHDAHGYKHGLGPCVCAACKAIHKMIPPPASEAPDQAFRDEAKAEGAEYVPAGAHPPYHSDASREFLAERADLVDGPPASALKGEIER